MIEEHRIYPQILGPTTTSDSLNTSYDYYILVHHGIPKIFTNVAVYRVCVHVFCPSFFLLRSQKTNSFICYIWVVVFSTSFYSFIMFLCCFFCFCSGVFFGPCFFSVKEANPQKKMNSTGKSIEFGSIVFVLIKHTNIVQDFGSSPQGWDNMFW